MKRTILAAIVALLSFVNTSNAQTYTKGYIKQNGTYVAPSYRTTPDNTKLNNYSTQGNYNPYSGSKGTKSPYSNSYIPYKAKGYR